MKNPRILLLMMPFWDPLIPPQGICHLKNFLQFHGFSVKTGDLNIERRFRQYYYRYFEVLSSVVPADKRGNFYNIGHDVLRNHTLAHLHYKTERQYLELVESIVYNTYFTPFSNEQIAQLNSVLNDFFAGLSDYLLALYDREKPDILGISVPRDTIAPSLFAFRLAKEKYPHIRTVMGGSIFSDHLFPGTPNFDFFVEKTPYIDKIIVGEGQQLFLKWLKHEIDESRKVLTLPDIGGQTMGFSPLNVPDLADFNIQEDYPYLAAQGSTSCPNQCSFCNVVPFYGPYREKRPEQTADEMIRLYRAHGLQLFFMADSQVNRLASGLATALLDRDVALYWDGYLRADPPVADVKNTLLWRRGGFYRARLGVESGSQRVLDAMNKNITPGQTRACLASLASVGIKTTTYWVIGHPGETEEDFLQTLDLVQELKNDIYEAECNPFIFGYAGQGKTDQWKDRRKPLYPDWAREMLLIQSWYVDEEPSRQETYNRINRFVGHCRRLGIPNPYSLPEIYDADVRWQRLHRNAAPSIVDFKDKGRYIDECKHIKPITRLQTSGEDKGDFDF